MATLIRAKGPELYKYRPKADFISLIEAEVYKYRPKADFIRTKDPERTEISAIGRFYQDQRS